MAFAAGVGRVTARLARSTSNPKATRPGKAKIENKTLLYRRQSRALMRRRYEGEGDLIASEVSNADGDRFARACLNVHPSHTMPATGKAFFDAHKTLINKKNHKCDEALPREDSSNLLCCKLHAHKDWSQI